MTQQTKRSKPTATFTSRTAAVLAAGTTRGAGVQQQKAG